MNEETKSALMQILDAGRACSGWSEVSVRLKAVDNLQAASSISDLNLSTITLIKGITEQLLQNGSMTYEGMRVLDPVMEEINKIAEKAGDSTAKVTDMRGVKEKVG